MQETGDVTVVGCFAEWPEETGCDFVADRDDVDCEAVFVKSVAYFLGVVV